MTTIQPARGGFRGRLTVWEVEDFIHRYSDYFHFGLRPRSVIDQQTGFVIVKEYPLYKYGGKGFIDLVALDGSYPNGYPIIAIEYDNNVSAFLHCRSPEKLAFLSPPFVVANLKCKYLDGWQKERLKSKMLSKGIDRDTRFFVYYQDTIERIT